MVARPKPDSKRPAGIQPGVLIGAVAALILIIGLLAWHNFGPTNTGTSGTPTAQQQAARDWLKEKARESGGDFDRLSPADQQKLTAQHGNMARYVLKGAANPVATDY